ncbi:MAG: glycoside hydrolase [Bacteroidota bacterium]
MKWIYCICLMGLLGISQAQQILIDPSVQYQEIDGFGASDAWRVQFVGANWPVEKREQIADLLFSKELDSKGNPKGIGLSIWRFYIGSGSMELGDTVQIPNEWRRAECFLNPDGTYDWNKQKGQRWFLQAAKKHGVNQFLAFALSAPPSYSLNGKTWSIKDDERLNIKPGYYDDYARFLVDVTDHFEKEEGIFFNYLSPVNEPQWDWSKPGQEGSAATNEDIYLLTKYLSKELAKRNSRTKLVIGEAAELNFLYNPYKASGNQVQTFFDPASSLFLGNLPNVASKISGHSYFTTWPIDTLNQVRKRLGDQLRKHPKVDFWQTEFCVMEQSPEIGGGWKRDLAMPTALYVARVIHHDLTVANASSWQWWTALTTYDYKDGLIYLDTGDETDLFNRDRMKQDGVYRESKLLWALGNYSRFVQPGMKRIKARIEDVDEKVSISAYYGKDNEVVMVLTNHQTKDQMLQLGDDFIPEAAYLTDEQHSLDLIPVNSGRIKLPAKSLLSIKGKIK